MIEGLRELSKEAVRAETVSELWTLFVTGEVIEVVPGEDWPVYLEEPAEVRYRILEGWNAFGALWRCLGRVLGGEGVCWTLGNENGTRYFIKYVPREGGWHDPI